ncbi:MAG: ABC transporter substrate-binding protein [Actinomycetota bacterium]|nr:ABC transporter substrate-binding protein [Actinomycetota bacterium]
MRDRISRRRFLHVAGAGLAGATLLGVTGCGGGGGGGGQGGGGGDEALKIGALLSFTGTFAKLAESIRNGFDLFIKENDGQLGGRPVEVLYEDDEGDPQVALRGYRQLVDRDQVNLLVGPVSSTVALALVDQVNRDKQILINPNAAANALSLDKKSDYIYRTSYSNYQLGTPGAAYIAENVGKTAVAIAPDYPAGLEVLPAFKAAYEEAGGTVVQELLPPLGNTDYATYLTQIKEAEPEVLWAFLAGADAINFIKQYRSFGLGENIQFTGMNTWPDPLLTETVGEAAEGIIAATQWFPGLDNETNKRFVESYQAEYDETPNQFSVFGYDAGQLIAQGLEEAGSAEPEALIEALKGVTFQSPRGEITIDPETNNPIQSYYMTRNVLEGGEIVPEVIEDLGEFPTPTENVPGSS